MTSKQMGKATNHGKFTLSTFDRTLHRITNTKEPGKSYIKQQYSYCPTSLKKGQQFTSTISNSG